MDDPELARVQELRLLGRPAEALALVAPLLESAWVRCDPQGTRAATVHNEFGLLLKATGEYDRAREHYETAWGIVRRAGDSEVAATILHNIGGIRFVQGDPAGAARWARRGLAMRRRLHGDDDLTVLLDEGNLAPMLVALGTYRTAQGMLDRLLARFTDRLGHDHLEVAVTLTNLGALAAHRDDWPAARAHLGRAARIKSEQFGADSPELVGTLANLAVATDRTGPADEAAQARARVLRVARTSLPASHPLRRHVEGLWPSA